MPHTDYLSSSERVASRCICCGNDNLEKNSAILMPFIAHRVFDWRPVLIDDSWQLKTIPNGYAYSVCNSLYCSDCDFLFLDMRFTDSEMARLYSDYRGPDYESLREHYEPGYAARNKLLNHEVTYTNQVEEFIRPYVTFPPAILDFGGDTGKNSPFKNSCKQLDIYDISNKDTVPGARLISKEDAIKVKYDLIVCAQTLEHVPNPFSVLTEIRSLMRKDTLLYIELPCEEIMKQPPQARSAKRHWHEHINFYSENSIVRLLLNCALQVSAIRSLDVEVANKPVSIFQVLAVSSD